jgi:hypothetical protein
MKIDDLIIHLRGEARDVKDCFTRFSFQALAISTAVIGLIIRFQHDSKWVSLSALSVIILVMSVAKIGNHKYNTTNRNLGFILYLERMESLKNEKPEVVIYSDNVPWEEAMRAWRIVQATAFGKVYSVGLIHPNKRILCCNKCNKNKTECEGKDTFWFEPMSIVRSKQAQYYAGSYLEAVQKILFFMAFISLIPIVISTLQFYISNEIIFSILFTSILLFTIVIIIWRISRIRARRKILEGGLLSIHSCGILWEAVIIAHKIALSITIKNNEGKPKAHLYESYTSTLSELAVELSNHICDIHMWVENNRHRILRLNLIKCR